MDERQEPQSGAATGGESSATDRAKSKLDDVSAKAKAQYEQASARMKSQYDSASKAVKDKYSTVKNKVDDVDFAGLGEQVRTYVRENPGKALLISVGVGFLFGLLLRQDEE